MEKDDAAEETKNDTAGAALEIKEYSEESFDEDDNDAGESKESGTQNEASESMEEAPDSPPEGRSKIEEEHYRNIAQQKKNRRARAQPGAKRGGRRDTERSGWGRRFRGKKKTQFQAGDLVEAEWAGSGWWYVGYVGAGEEEEPAGASERKKAGKRKNDVFHVKFIDGDEADVRGKDLKPLGKPGVCVCVRAQ